MIYKAILEAYRHVIPAGKFPIVILFMTLPPSAVDVNVHPTKAEVKFKDPERIYQTVLASIRMVLEEGSIPLGRISFSREGEGGHSCKKEFNPLSHFENPLKPYPPLVTEGKTLRDSMVREGGELQWKVGKKIPFRILGQIQGTYILCEGEEDLVVIDQHAAHERILFEKFKKEFETKAMRSEKLLIPILMELSVEESLILESAGEAFQAIGFEIEPMGENSGRFDPSLLLSITRIR